MGIFAQCWCCSARGNSGNFLGKSCLKLDLSTCTQKSLSSAQKSQPDKLTLNAKLRLYIMVWFLCETWYLILVLWHYSYNPSSVRKLSPRTIAACTLHWLLTLVVHHYLLLWCSQVMDCLLEDKKAFDTMWHGGLSCQLWNYWASMELSHTLVWQINLLCPMETQVLTPYILAATKVWNKAVSSPLYSTASISYVNDLLVEFENSGVGARLGYTYPGAPIYANDLAWLLYPQRSCKAC